MLINFIIIYVIYETKTTVFTCRVASVITTAKISSQKPKKANVLVSLIPG